MKPSFNRSKKSLRKMTKTNCNSESGIKASKLKDAIDQLKIKTKMVLKKEWQIVLNAQNTSIK